MVEQAEQASLLELSKRLSCLLAVKDGVTNSMNWGAAQTLKYPSRRLYASFLQCRTQLSLFPS
jgi:hypothetical protein